jgi:triosephosphate isomerase
MIIFNLKTYPESTGKHAEDIVRMFESLINEGEVQTEKFSIAPSILDLSNLRKQFRKVNLMSQNVTKKNPGSTTGWPTPENLIDQEVTFSLYNHSEIRSFSDTFVEDIKDIQSRGISLVVCVENIDEAKLALEANAFGIAYEPKELIGSGISVTTKPEEVTKFIDLVQGKTMPFIGAGVTTGDDVKKCMELGAKGVLLASAFVKAEDQRAKALELLSF